MSAEITIEIPQVDSPNIQKGLDSLTPEQITHSLEVVPQTGQIGNSSPSYEEPVTLIKTVATEISE